MDKVLATPWPKIVIESEPQFAITIKELPRPKIVMPSSNIIQFM